MTVKSQIPEQFKSGLIDQILYWMKSQCDSQIHLLITLDGRIDEAVLKKAVRLAIDAEPVLGCKYVPKTWWPVWQRLKNLDSMELVTVVETANDVSGIAAYLEQKNHVDTFKGPQLKITVLRDKTDIICIKMSHYVADGGGLKELSYLLSDIYNQLLKDPEYLPPINIDCERGLRQVARHFSAKDIYNIVVRSCKDMLGMFIPFVRQQPAIPEPDFNDRAFEIIKVGPEQFKKIRAYGKKNKATMNEIVVAAFLRMFYTKINPGKKAIPRVVITVDLRRFIPGGKAESICNLPGFIYVNIGKKLGETFEETLEYVKAYMEEIKNDYPGFGGNMLFTVFCMKFLPMKVSLWLHDTLYKLMEKQVVFPGKIVPILTNSGRTDESHYFFGDVKGTNLLISAPLSYSPAFAVTITMFKDELTLCSGFSEKTLSRQRVKKFFEDMVKELPE